MAIVKASEVKPSPSPSISQPALPMPDLTDGHNMEILTVFMDAINAIAGRMDVIEERLDTVAVRMNLGLIGPEHTPPATEEPTEEPEEPEAGEPEEPSPAEIVATATEHTAYECRKRLAARYGRDTQNPTYAESSLRALVGYYWESSDGSPLQDGDKTSPHYMAALKEPSPRLATLRQMTLATYGEALWTCPAVLAWLARPATEHGNVCRLAAMMDKRNKPEDVIAAYAA